MERRTQPLAHRLARRALLIAAVACLALACESGSDAARPTLVPTVVDPLSADALRAHVSFLAELEPARSYGNAASLEKAAVYLEREFAAAGGRIVRQTFEVGGESYANVRCFLGPEEGARLVVGAHYDSYGDLPGADDNASGTAVLLALAHALRDVELAAPVELVAFVLEEPPQYDTRDMGSARHARLLREEGAELRGMICLEMLGYYSEEAGSQSYPVDEMELLFGDKADFLAVVGRPEDAALVEAVHAAMQGTPLRVEKVLAPPALTGVDFSDHRSFWAEGYTATMLTDTSFYRNANYHTAADTADTLDYVRMAHAVQGVRAAVVALAGKE
ncbi:MAG: M28 family peptidase [Planctomycetes bacterium]|nr:M28 family peptidase [Planctomycetota bacterium]